MFAPGHETPRRDEGVHARQKSGFIDLDFAFIDVDLAVDHLQFGTPGKSEGYEIIHLDRPNLRAIQRFVDDEGRMVGPVLLGPIETEQLAQGDFRRNEVIFCLDESGSLVAQADLGAQDVEARGSACIEERFLARFLLIEKGDRLVVRVDLAPRSRRCHRPHTSPFSARHRWWRAIAPARLHAPAWRWQFADGSCLPNRDSVWR